MAAVKPTRRRVANKRLAETAIERKVGRTDPSSYLFLPLRPAVLDTIQIESGLSHKVIAIVAPVGYGKSVSMSLLLDDLCRKGKQCRWLALDEPDTPLEGILSTLISLIDVRESALEATQALFSDNRSINSQIDTLIDLIDRYPLPLTLFIDNLNECTDPRLGQFLDKLVFRTRSDFQLALSSTQELPLNLSRANLEGLIRSIDLTELAFDREGVSHLLGDDLCTQIGAQGLQDVIRHTEGWPAAVRMAQIILDNSLQPKQALAKFTGADESIAHLLNRQVLSGFPEPVRGFLLDVAQLRTFCIDLCIHVTGNPASADIIAYLLQRNAFVIPLDRNRSWYRFHGLFREFLVGEAERSLSPSARLLVKKRAANWCEENGYWRECLDYSLAAKHFRIAVRVLERMAERFVRDQGDIIQYIRWMEALHEQGTLAGPEAEYWFAWALSFCRRYEEARQRCSVLTLKFTEELDVRKNKTIKAAPLLRRIEILRASLDSLTDRMQEAHIGAKKWLAELDGAADAAFNMTNATCIESCYFANEFDFVKARQAAQAAKEAAFQTHSAYVSGWVTAYSAIVPVYEGDYAAAYLEIGSALATVRAVFGDNASICGTLALVGAKCAIEMGLDEEARLLLDSGLESSHHHGYLEAVGCGLEAATLVWQGDEGEPVSPSILREIAACYPPRLALMLECYLIRRLIRLGRTDEALAEAARVGLGNSNSLHVLQTNAGAHLRETLDAAQIDILMARGRLTQAEALINEESRKASSKGRMGKLVEFDLNMVELALRSGRIPSAVRHFTHAISIATMRRIVRPFVDRSTSISTLVYAKGFSATGLVSREELRFFSEICQRLRIDISHQKSWDAKDGQPMLLSKLTPRELEILRLIDAGLTNQELADRTQLTLTTVKWHLHNLYAKLGAARRGVALAKARALGLIS